MIRIALGTSVLIVITVLIFVFSIPHANTPGESGPAPLVIAPVVPGISIRDVYKKGAHTITGSLKVPNHCTTVSVESVLDGEPTKGILILLTVLEDEGICLQEKVERSFTTSIVAEEKMPIRVLINGTEATVTLL